MSELEPIFPLEFVVYGTPVSSQGSSNSKQKWKQRVKDAAYTVLPEGHFAYSARVAMTLFYFPNAETQGDVDNIIKPIADALKQHVILDDSQIVRIVAQKFEPGAAFSFSAPSNALTEALTGDGPVLYVKLSDDPFEELT